jgi:hypothetical protein
MKRFIIIAILLFGCSHERGETPSPLQVVNTKQLKDVARDFLRDIGGVEVAISSSVSGFYFDPKIYQKNEINAYKKWRPLFAKPKNCKLSEVFQIDYQGISLLSLFCLPKTNLIKKENVAAICLPSFSVPFELDPRWILTYLSKGIHVLAINYEQGEKTTSADWEQTCQNGMLASFWLQKRLHSKILVVGKSLGAIPASYVAANTPNASLILENMMILNPLSNRELLKNVQGKILAIQTLNSKKIIQLPKHAELMTVIGSHFGPYWGEPLPTWYENEKDQIKLLKFLTE